MQKSLIAILTQKPKFASRLPELLRETFEILVCDSIAEVEELLTARNPRFFIADFEHVIAGGHIEDQLVDELETSHPEMTIFMVTAPETVEPLERRADDERVVRLCGTQSVDAIAEAVLQFAETQAPNRTSCTGKPTTGAAVAKPALAGASSTTEQRTGLAQRFETNTPELRRMLEELEIAARHTVTVLLIGETGCGKTHLSRLIHEVSPRADEPFLHVACGALPAELIESELFGHAKGAFTSAHADKEGKFVAARRGTILLDEIDVLGPEQQVKLLRVIETGEFEPVGSNQTLRSQARLVVASNLDLQPLVEQGRFRPDLYYRLNMLKFEIPPLRQRQPDVASLARLFVSRLSERHGVAIKRIDSDLLDALQNYPWPGNVRELENVIQRAVIYCRDGVLSARNLPQHVLAGHAGPKNDPTVSLGPRAMREDGRRKLESKIARTERDIIEQALYENNYSRTNTARELGISRVTLYNKMKKYGMSK